MAIFVFYRNLKKSGFQLCFIIENTNLILMKFVSLLYLILLKRKKIILKINSIGDISLRKLW